MGVRRWFFGTFRPDAIETDSLSTDDIPLSSWTKWGPRNVVRTEDIIRHYVQPTLDFYNTNSSGSGSQDDSNADRIELSTGSTSGSFSVAYVQARQQTNVSDFTLSENQEFFTSIEFRDSMSDRVDYITVGDINNSNKGFGFKVESGSLLGVVHDGNSESTTTLLNSPSTGGKELRAVFTSGTDVVFHVDGAQKGSISSGLPSGTYNRSRHVTRYVENTSAVDRGLWINETRFYQEGT